MIKTEIETTRAPGSSARTGSIYLSYSQKMRTLRQWCYENCCKGRKMKTPVIRGRDIDIAWSEPRCFGGDFYPQRVLDRKNPYSIAPSILITRISHTPHGDTLRYLDNRSKISRPKDVANMLTVNLIHTIYEPGERGEDGADGDPHDLFLTGEEMDEGSLILGQWMDDTATALLSAMSIAGMSVSHTSVTIEPLIENSAVSDRRPLYMGVVQATLIGINREWEDPKLREMLE